jgi:hypothetical protein
MPKKMLMAALLLASSTRPSALHCAMQREMRRGDNPATAPVGAFTATNFARVFSQV